MRNQVKRAVFEFAGSGVFAKNTGKMTFAGNRCCYVTMKRRRVGARNCPMGGLGSPTGGLITEQRVSL